MKMTLRKTFVVLGLICMMFFGIVLTACEEKVTPKELKIVSGIDSQYNLGDEVDLDGVKLQIVYSDKTTKDITGGDESIVRESNLTTNAVGNYKVVFIYIENDVRLKAEKSVKVVDPNADAPAPEYDSILAFNTPTLVTTFNTNIKSDAFLKNEDSLEENEKIVYHVGSQNAFVMKPSIAVVNAGEIDNVSSFYTNIKIELVDEDGTTMHELKNSGEYLLNTYLSNVDNFEQTYSFKKAAEGKLFNITVSLDQSKYEDVSILSTAKGSFSFVVKVVDAYNVYNAIDMSVIDNTETTNADGIGNWDAIKKANKLTVDGTTTGTPISNVNKIVLHNDITIEKEDLPTSFFVSDETLTALAQKAGGNASTDYTTLKEANIDVSMKDHTYIYNRTFANHETFNLYGNYFTIDASKVPLIGCKWDASTWNAGTVNSHSKIFVFEREQADVNAEEDFENTEEDYVIYDEVCNFFDLKVLGNSTKKAGSTILSSVYTGGLSLIEDSNILFNVDNVSASDCYIGLMVSATISDKAFYDEVSAARYMKEMKHSLNRLNLQNSYNSSMYLCGCGSVDIKNSISQNSGGPAMICDTVSIANYDLVGASGVSQANINKRAVWVELNIENSTIEAFANGTETWFVQQGATGTVGQIKAISTMFNGYSAQAVGSATAATTKAKTFVVDSKNNYEYINVQALFKSSAIEGFTPIAIRGKMVVDGAVVADYNVYADMEKALTDDGYLTNGFVTGGSYSGANEEEVAGKIVGGLATVFGTLEGVYNFYLGADETTKAGMVAAGISMGIDKGIGSNVLALFESWGEKRLENAQAYYYQKIGSAIGAPVFETEATYEKYTDEDKTETELKGPEKASLITNGSGLLTLSDMTSGAFDVGTNPSVIYSGNANSISILYPPTANMYIGVMGLVLGYKNG